MLFMDEIKQLRPTLQPKWLLLGDFNLIYRARDKNNSLINRTLMNRFKAVLDDLELKELHLHGRRFTWTSETENPTMTKIDHIFCTRDWELSNTDCFVQAISSSMSDHCPMLLTCSHFRHRNKAFKFESFWTKMHGFIEVVRQAWTRQVRSEDKIRTLHIKLSGTARALKNWSRTQVGILKRQADIANEIILRLDQALEQRQLTNDELSLRTLAKQRVVGLATVRRIQNEMRQRSRLVGIRPGDANTRLICHLVECGQRFLICRKQSTPQAQTISSVLVGAQIVFYHVLPSIRRF